MENNFNRVQLCGTVDSEPVFSHANHGISFFKFTLAVERLSGLSDKLAVIVSAPLLAAVRAIWRRCRGSFAHTTTKAVRAAGW